MMRLICNLMSITLALALIQHSAQAEPITVAAFNVENLFDTANDPSNPRDDTYLPLSVKKKLDGHDKRCEALNGTDFFRKQCKTLDWNDATYRLKLKRIADVIKAMPTLPHVIVVPETENKRVLDDLIAQQLGGLGFEAIQLDTSDKPTSRGIDVGLLTRLPVVGTVAAHPIDFKKDAVRCGPSRDIVEATFELPGGSQLTVFGVHFPSGGKRFRCRVRSMLALRKHADTIPKGRYVVAAGDFNINCNETTSPAFQRLLARGDWFAPPEVSVGCKAPGSSKFRDGLNDGWFTWSFLDMILVREELSPSRPNAGDWFADLGSFATQVVHPQQVGLDDDNKGYVEPRRFDPKTGLGVSDHWPVSMRLMKRR